MMLVNKNEVIPFQKSPWNALCKIGILLKIPLFSKPNFERVFQSSTTTASFLYSQQPLNVAEIVRLQIREILESSRKNRHFQEN